MPLPSEVPPLLDLALRAAQAAATVIRRAAADPASVQVRAKHPNDFVTQVDVRLSQKLPALRNGQRALLTLDIFNAASLLNHNWGGVRVVPGANQTLLNVIGFDQASREYRYRVNPNFGRTVRSGNRYQMQLGVRYEF